MMNSKIDGKAVTFDIDTTIYPYEIVVETANNFLDSCFVFMDKKDDSQDKISVSLEPKGEEKPKEVLGSFFNMMNGLLYRSINEKEEEPIEQSEEEYDEEEYDPERDYDPDCDCEDCRREKERRERENCKR